MGRHSRATLAHVSNLGHAQKKLRAHVEDITDPMDPDFDGNQPQRHPVDLLEEGFFILDEDLGSDTEDEMEDEECEDESTDKPVTDADIVAFTKMLAEAQLAVVKAECIARAKKPNRKCHYTGNSKRTKQYHAQKRQKLKETGQQFIQTFFKKKSNTESMPAGLQTNNDGIEALGGDESRNVEAEVPEEDEDEEPAVEIVADSGKEHLRRLFPEDDNIQVSISRQL